MFGERVHETAEGCFGVGATEPGKGGGSASGNLFAAPDSDKEVVGELPDGVGDGAPQCHGRE